MPGRKQGLTWRPVEDLPSRPRRFPELALDFRTLGVRALGRVGGMVFHAFFQSAQAFADSLTQFRELLGAEYQQGDKKDDKQVHRLKQAFKHKNSSTTPNACLVNVTEPDY